MTQLSMIKKHVYTGGKTDLSRSQNEAMAHMNLMNLHQERFHDIQDFRDQYRAMKNLFIELGLHFGRCKEDARALLK